MAARGSVSSQDIVRAAIQLADEQGIENVTWRSLGSALGMHHTSLYRQFQGMNELMGVVFETLVQDAIVTAQPLSSDPRHRLIDLSRAMRATLRLHPTLVAAIVNSGGPLPKSIEYMRMGLGALADMGLEGDALAVWYQAIETHTMGSALFDYAGAPHHLEARRQRYRLFESAALDAVATDEAHIDEVNERAFEAALQALVGAAAQAVR